MKIQMLDNPKKKKFIEGIENLGVKKIPELLIRSGAERVRAYSGILSKEEIMDLWRVLPVEGIGLYVGKEMIDKSGIREVRLSVDALHLWKDQITKNILILDESQEEKWFFGRDVEVDQKNMAGQFVVVQSESSKDFIGTGKISQDGKTAFNYLPKERRRRTNTI